MLVMNPYNKYSWLQNVVLGSLQNVVLGSLQNVVLGLLQNVVLGLLQNVVLGSQAPPCNIRKQLVHKGPVYLSVYYYIHLISRAHCLITIRQVSSII